MYKVIIADDEPVILAGIGALIDWQALGLELCALCKNGQEALNAALECQADILITDISMPVMDGLTLITQAKQAIPQMKYLILSGYDEFAYAQEALRLGVENYILKPINAGEMLNSLQMIIEKLDARNSFYVPEQDDMVVLKENIYNRWVQQRIEMAELSERRFLLDIDVDLNHYCIVMVTGGDGSALKIHDNAIQMACFLDQMQRMVWILGSNKPLDSKRIKRILKIQAEYSGLTISLSRAVVGSLLAAAYDEAAKLQKYALTLGKGKLFLSNSIDDFSALNELKVDFGLLAEELRIGDEQTINDLIADFFSNHECYTPDSILAVAHEVLHILLKSANEYGCELGDIRQKLAHEIECSYEVEKIVQSLQQLAEVIVTCREKRQPLTPVIRQIIRQVQQSYNEPATLKDLAGQFHMNASYLGQLFHHEVGINFAEYCNQVRLEHAYQLIIAGEHRINSIAAQVGYSDISYFYRKFKQRYGVSPKSVRSQGK